MLRLRTALLLSVLWPLEACGDDDDAGEGPAPDAAVAGDEAGDEAGGETPADSAAANPIQARIDRLFPADPEFGQIDRELVRRMMEVPPEEDGPFFMVNFIEHHAEAQYADGRETGLTGAAADAVYGEMIFPILTEIGARPVFVAEAEMTLMTDDGVVFDQVGVVRYPSHAAFFEMLEREDFQQAVVHKNAGVKHTLVMPAQLIEAPYPDDFLEVDLTAVPFPPTDEDTPLAIVHLYDYRAQAEYEDGRETELTGEEAVNLYSMGRQEQGVLDLGVRPALWLDVDGMLIGDDRLFDEFRINLFPSHATFADVAGTSEEAGIVHRAAGLAHHYTLMTLPLLNEYGYR